MVKMERTMRNKERDNLVRLLISMIAFNSQKVTYAYSLLLGVVTSYLLERIHWLVQVLQSLNHFWAILAVAIPFYVKMIMNAGRKCGYLETIFMMFD